MPVLRAKSSNRQKALPEKVDVSGPVELVLLALKDRAARCYLLESGNAITLRASGIWRAAPGQSVIVRADRVWRFSGHLYISGKIERVRTDAAALTDAVEVARERTVEAGRAREAWSAAD